MASNNKRIFGDPEAVGQKNTEEDRENADPKQKFSEIKKETRNQNRLITFETDYCSMPFKITENKPKILKDQSYCFIENPICDNEFMTLEDIASKDDDEISRIINGNYDEIHSPIPNMPVRPSVDIFNELNNENFFFESNTGIDLFVPIGIPELTNDDFQSELIDDLK